VVCMPDQWETLVNTLMTFYALYKLGNYIVRWAIMNFSRGLCSMELVV
jgi:hypothetical protein